MFNLIHNDSAFKIDCIVRKNSVYRDTEFKRRKQLDVDGTFIWVVLPEDLIISKLFWAKDSEADLQIRDVKNILAALKSIDYTYLKNWVEKLDLTLIYKRTQN